MRYALIAVTIALCGCGGGGGAAHSAPSSATAVSMARASSAFAPLVGRWSATCTQGAADLGVTIGEFTTFTVDSSGRLVGLTPVATALDDRLVETATGRYVCAFTAADGSSQLLQIDTQTATLSRNGNAPAVWRIAPELPPEPPVSTG